MKRSTDYPLELRPVMGFEDDYPAGFVDPFHSHDRAQLSYANSGVMLFVTDHTSFVLPPQRAIWLPAGVRHKAVFKVYTAGLYLPAKANTAHEVMALPGAKRVKR